MKKKNLEVEILVLKTRKPIVDFAKARNSLLTQAKKEWVLFIDSDEIVTEGLKKEIDKLPNGRMAVKYKGFYLARKNYFLGQPIGVDKILRLAKRDSGNWERRVHETWNIKGKIGELKNSIIHNTADNLYQYIEKIDSYARLHALANKEEGKGSSLFEIILYPKLKFLQTFFSSRHFVFSLLQSLHSFLAWSRLWLDSREN